MYFTKSSQKQAQHQHCHRGECRQKQERNGQKTAWRLLKVTIGDGITPEMAQSWLIQYENDAFTARNIDSAGNSPRAILAVQASLRHLGYFDGERLDGVFGPKTQKAVSVFQERWNKEHPKDRIVVTGLPTPETKGRLIQAMPDKKSASVSRSPAPQEPGARPTRRETVRMKRTEREALENTKNYFETRRDDASVVTDEGIAERAQLNEILNYIQYMQDGVLKEGEEEECTEMVRNYVKWKLNKLPHAEREKELQYIKTMLSYEN